VADCDAPGRLAVDAQVTGAANEVFHLTVDPRGLDVVGYDWDFGDGTREQGSRATVTHSYATRPQDRRYSYFLVTVTARDRRGVSVSRSTTLELANPRYLRSRS
jgi:hypothetical protein